MKLFSYLRLRFNEFAYNMHRPRILRLMGASTVLPGCLMPIFSFLRGFFRIRQILTFDVPMGVGNIFILLPSLFFEDISEVSFVSWWCRSLLYCRWSFCCHYNIERSTLKALGPVGGIEVFESQKLKNPT